MRLLSSGEQEDRRRRLLQAIIHHYIKTAKPVGSATLVEEYRIDLSPATIRNAMADLENEGFLTHPHTSAGRIPTDKAYRYYVNSLMQYQRLAQAEEERLRLEYEQRIREINELMQATSKSLSALSHFSGFALSPKLEESCLHHVNLIPLDAHRVLAVFVAESGVVKNRLLVFEGGYEPESLQSLARLANETLRGEPFHLVREKLLSAVEEHRQREAHLLSLAQEMCHQGFTEVLGDNLFVEGASNILSLPDFQDQEQMISLAHLLDEKQTLGEVLTRDFLEHGAAEGQTGVHVKIGSELNSPELKNLSVISSTYEINGRTVGVVGVIGPKRMEYPRMIGLVGAVSRVVSGVLNRLAGR